MSLSIYLSIDLSIYFIYLCLLSLTLFSLRAVPIRIPSRKLKQSSLSGMFCRIAFIPIHFNRNRNRNRFVPVKFEILTISDICDQNVMKSVFA